MGLPTLKERVTEYVQNRDYVSFVELKQFITSDPEGFPVEGPMAMHVPERPNSIIWVNMSEEFTELMAEMLAAHQIYIHGASWMIYLIDGGMPTMPIAKRPNKAKDYTKEHWLPVCFRTVQ